MCTLKNNYPSTYKFWIRFGGVNRVNQRRFARPQEYLLLQIRKVLAVIFRHINLARSLIAARLGVLGKQEYKVFFLAIPRPIHE